MRIIAIIIGLIVLVASNAFSQSGFVSFDDILNNYDENKYILLIANVLENESQKYNGELFTARSMGLKTKRTLNTL